ncbi:MAG: hypothetical protein GX488_01450 [Clostridiales bacterium]|nr:hypothetical protein [Clostridiales bacterium]
MEHQDEFVIRWMLKRMGIRPSAYYNYLKHKKADYHARKGVFLSKTTVFKYMNKELRLLCICRRRCPGYKKGQVHKIFPSLLNQHFEAAGKNRVWYTDFTYLFLSNGSLRYNCTITDLYDRSVVASEVGKGLQVSLRLRRRYMVRKMFSGNPFGITGGGIPSDSTYFNQYGMQMDSAFSNMGANNPISIMGMVIMIVGIIILIVTVPLLSGYL